MTTIGTESHGRTMTVVTASRDGLSCMDWFNPRNGAWAHRECVQNVLDTLDDLVAREARERCNRRSQYWRAYKTARRLASDFGFRASGNTSLLQSEKVSPTMAALAERYEILFRGRLPYPKEEL